VTAGGASRAADSLRRTTLASSTSMSTPHPVLRRLGRRIGLRHDTQVPPYRRSLEPCRRSASVREVEAGAERLDALRSGRIPPSRTSPRCRLVSSVS
jgi:hypothetical protein